MYRALVLAALLVLSASPVLAAESLTAGFTQAPVWLSTSDPVEGDRVEAYTVLYNASEEALEGSLSFLVDGETIGSTPFSLRPGESEIRSVRWTAIEGEHSLAARIETAIYADTKREAEIPSRTTASTTIHVTELHEEEREERRDRPAVAAIVTSITESSPAVAAIVATIVNAGEGTRTAGEALVAGYAGQEATSEAANTTEDDGRVLGTSTQKDTSSRSLTEKAASTMLPLFAYPALFYPILLFILMLVFWFVARRLRNPRKRRRR